MIGIKCALALLLFGVSLRSTPSSVSTCGRKQSQCFSIGQSPMSDAFCFPIRATLEWAQFCLQNCRRKMHIALLLLLPLFLAGCAQQQGASNAGQESIFGPLNAPNQTPGSEALMPAPKEANQTQPAATGSATDEFARLAALKKNAEYTVAYETLSTAYQEKGITVIFAKGGTTRIDSSNSGFGKAANSTTYIIGKSAYYCSPACAKIERKTEPLSVQGAEENPSMFNITAARGRLLGGEAGKCFAISYGDAFRAESCYTDGGIPLFMEESGSRNGVFYRYVYAARSVSRNVSGADFVLPREAG